MKFFKLFGSIPFFAILAVLVLASCKDEEEPVNTKNTFVFNGIRYTFNQTLLRNIGKKDLTRDGEQEDTHYSYDMVFTDGEITPSPINASYTLTNARYEMTFRLGASIGEYPDGLTTGVFNPIDPAEYFGGQSSLKGKSFFTAFLLKVDRNGQAETINITAGTIKIKGSGDTFTVDFENTATDVSIIGSYEGKFLIVDE
jgi:hypothetical protein